MIRFIFLNGVIAVVSIFFCLGALLVALFDRRGGRLVHSLISVPWAKVILWVCGVKTQVRGKENLDPGVPRIYLSNHQSYFDIFALLACLPVQFKFVMKAELMRIPLLGPAMRRAGYIGIERDDPRKAIQGMNEAARKARDGASILVFPEGTRSVDGQLQPFKPGGFHLALKSGCDIVPVAISGTRFIVPKGSLRIERGFVQIHIGRPLPVGGYSKREMPRLMEKARETLLTLMNPEMS